MQNDSLDQLAQLLVVTITAWQLSTLYTTSFTPLGDTSLRIVVGVYGPKDRSSDTGICFCVSITLLRCLICGSGSHQLRHNATDTPHVRLVVVIDLTECDLWGHVGARANFRCQAALLGQVFKFQPVRYPRVPSTTFWVLWFWTWLRRKVLQGKIIIASTQFWRLHQHWHGPGQTEVTDADVTLVVDQYVFRLKITVQ